MGTEKNSEITPFVSVCTIVYNHEPFLEQYFEGILKQKTNFPFEVLIHDDASTDKSADVIRQYVEKYPTLFKPIFQTENQYSKGVSITLAYQISRVQGKYIAFCEGDDYWTDPLKLQKQVDFLETHPDYNLYCHNWEVDTEGKITPSPVAHLYKDSLTFEFGTLPWVWITKTATLLFRHQVFDYSLLKRYEYTRDVHYVYHLLRTGKGYYDPTVMGRYRIHEGGIWGGDMQEAKHRTTYNLYKELFQYEKNKAVKKRYLNATLAYFNYQLYHAPSLKKFCTSWVFYVEAIKLIQDSKDIIFVLGALFPSKIISYIMKKIKI